MIKVFCVLVEVLPREHLLPTDLVDLLDALSQLRVSQGLPSIAVRASSRGVAGGEGGVGGLVKLSGSEGEVVTLHLSCTALIVP